MACQKVMLETLKVKKSIALLAKKIKYVSQNPEFCSIRPISHSAFDQYAVYILQCQPKQIKINVFLHVFQAVKG